MRYLLLSIPLVFLWFSFSVRSESVWGETVEWVLSFPSSLWRETVEWNDLVGRDGLYYKKYTNDPFTGKVNGTRRGGVKNGKIDDYWFVYSDNGPFLLEGMFSDGVVGEFKNGKIDGDWVVYFANGQLAFRGTFSDGVAQGDWVQYFDNGQLAIKGVFESGEVRGQWVVYWENGQLATKGVYENGEKEGQWVDHWENGQLQIKENYKNGVRHGERVRWLENGQLWAKGVFKNGKRNGLWEFYNVDGSKNHTSGFYKDDYKQVFSMLDEPVASRSGNDKDG